MAKESSKSLLDKFEELPAKAADKVVETALRIYRGITDKEALPANQKVFLDTFVDKNKGAITEKFFNQAELRALGKLIASKGGETGSIKYDDYAAVMKPADVSVGKKGILEAGKNPYESLRTTLGQFNYRRDPTTQNYVVEDMLEEGNINIIKQGRVEKIRRRIRRNAKGRIVVQKNRKRSGIKGYRIAGGNRVVRISATARIKKARLLKRSWKTTRRAKLRRTLLKRKMSMRRRSSMGLK
jgi:hypothetical protein